MNPNARKGSTLDSLFEELGELKEVRLATRKKVIAEQLREAMKSRNITPSRMARMMGTSRPVVYRMLDPKNTGLTLETLAKASTVLGLDLEVKLAADSAADRRGDENLVARRARKLRTMADAYDGRNDRRARELLEALVVAREEGGANVGQVMHALAVKLSKRRAA